MKTVCFGEILMRLSPPGGSLLVQTQSLDVVFGGSEANVAVALSQWGTESQMVTCVPHNDLGKAALGSLAKYEVGIRDCLFAGERLGIYFYEPGAGRRAGKVIYDRAHSGMATLEAGRINWEHILREADWFHWSGITPALSEASAAALSEALHVATQRGIPVSCDLNYREKLWKYGKIPEQVMPELVKHCTVLLGDRTSFDVCLNMRADSPKTLLEKVSAQFPRLTHVSMSEREGISATHNRLKGFLYDGRQLFESRLHDIPDIVDRIGAGDALMAGLIYGLSQGNQDLQQVIEFATAAAVMKHYIRGDFNLATRQEINALMEGNSGGKVNR